MKFDKKKIFIEIPIVLFVLLFFSSVLNFAYLWAYKQVVNVIYITDPKNPEFRKEEFSFYKYANFQDLHDAMMVMFPPGTKKEYVENILITHAAAEARDYGDFVSYKHPRHGLWPYMFSECSHREIWAFKIYYNKNKEVEKIHSIGFC